MGDGATVVGFATVLLSTGSAELEDLFVDPDHLGQGAGTLLVADMVELARERRLDRIEVTANPHATGFYERTGFLSVGPVESALGQAIRMWRPVA